MMDIGIDTFFLSRDYRAEIDNSRMFSFMPARINCKCPKCHTFWLNRGNEIVIKTEFSITHTSEKFLVIILVLSDV